MLGVHHVGAESRGIIFVIESILVPRLAVRELSFERQILV